MHIIKERKNKLINYSKRQAKHLKAHKQANILLYHQQGKKKKKVQNCTNLPDNAFLMERGKKEQRKKNQSLV